MAMPATAPEPARASCLKWREVSGELTHSSIQSRTTPNRFRFCREYSHRVTPRVHDWRNPLITIHGRVQRLLQKAVLRSPHPNTRHPEGSAPRLSYSFPESDHVRRVVAAARAATELRVGPRVPSTEPAVREAEWAQDDAEEDDARPFISPIPAWQFSSARFTISLAMPEKIIWWIG